MMENWQRIYCILYQLFINKQVEIVLKIPFLQDFEPKVDIVTDNETIE